MPGAGNGPGDPPSIQCKQTPVRLRAPSRMKLS